MNKTLLALIFGLVPLVAAAGGNHAGHDMQHSGMAGMHSEGHASAAGQPGEQAKVNRTIEVTMDDNMRFNPGLITVKAGETIRFFVKNVGKTQHEMVIGTADELKEHAEMMRKMPGMQHAEPNMVTLAPGKRGGVVWQFSKAGQVDFACLIPGHMEAGMKGLITVE
ncbi:MAG: hypothetical protein A2Z93_01630 [Curvibacter sp. GWA2_64_110]|nr:MAG: hypothetical protein A2Z93_01630 [Curvibacter sp. GWA2_64_110]HCY15459.1 hypothetical protein [Curvibacter sp.]